jgi:vacuolar-type H+-ATPase subunit E/Vma4
MPLENILQALEAEADGQLAEIERHTGDEIERIRAEARAEAVQVRRKRLAETRAPLQAERARILNQAKLEAVRVVMGARETLIASAVEATARRLEVGRAAPAYATWLQRLAHEAAGALGPEGQLRLRVQDRDLELMRRIVHDMGLSATVEGGLESEDSPWGCLGGLVATTPDARISLVNTLDARLRRVAGLYRSQIAGLVFDDRGEG